MPPGPDPISRRTVLGAFGGLALSGGCALPTPHDPDVIRTAQGEELTPQTLLPRVRAADVLLLGELHDNRYHHDRRGRLLAALGAPVSVVAEHLPQGAEAQLGPAMDSAALRQALVDAGFDVRGWEWPVHEPLFAAVARAGHRLVGGNLAPDLARRIVRGGPSVLPAELRQVVDAAPLAAEARRELERDLLDSHCGRMPGNLMGGMVWAQRGRDAAMARALLDALDRRAGGANGAVAVAPAASAGSTASAASAPVPSSRAGLPVVLLAGNGHVRRDYGVPQLLAALRPGLRVLAIGLAEHGGSDARDAAPLYDIVWTTDAVERQDPCQAMPAPRAASA